MQEYAGKIKLVIKHYPYRYRDYSTLAAQASEAARVQGKFWEMHDLLLGGGMLDRDSLIGYASDLGLNMTRFQRELDGKVFLPRVEADLALARKLEFFQTPTFVINGVVLVGERPIEKFREIIDGAIMKVEEQ